MKQSAWLLWLLTLPAFLSTPSCSRVSAKTADEPASAVPVRAARAVIEDVPLDVAAVGTVEAINSVDVKPQVAGPIARVAFREGEEVAKGQLLFTIDREGLNRQAAEQQAMAERDAAMAEQAQANLVRDQASEKQSRADAEVAVKLGDLGVLSGQRVHQLTTASDAAGAGVSSDRASLAAAEGMLRADRARAAQIGYQQSLTDITAPISGRAGAVLARAGNLVRANETTLVTLLQLAPIYVSFGIPEQLLPRVTALNARGPLPVVAAGAASGEAEGRLSFIDNQIDAQTGSVRMKAVFPNQGKAFWPGEFIPIRLRLRIDPCRVVVPDSAIEEGVSGKYAWVLHGGRAAMTPVQEERVSTERDGRRVAVIAGGIRPGDIVVTDGQLRLTADAKVAILNPGR